MSAMDNKSQEEFVKQIIQKFKKHLSAADAEAAAKDTLEELVSSGLLSADTVEKLTKKFSTKKKTTYKEIRKKLEVGCGGSTRSSSSYC